MSVKNYNVPVPSHLATMVANAIKASGARYIGTPYQDPSGDWRFSYEEGNTTAFMMAFILETKPITEVRKDGKIRCFLRRIFGAKLVS